MDFSLLLSSYATVWSNPEVLLMTFIGALGGVLLGAIPGMTATMGVALLIPFSFGMDLIPSIGLLLGIYCGGMYGGSISAILIHAPGTPAAAATLLDGYPMCQKGQAGKALSVAMFASFVGGVIGALIRPRRNVHAGGLRPLRDRRHLRQVHRQGSCERLLRHAAVHRRPRPDQRHPALHHL